jgi:hypothetical protein
LALESKGEEIALEREVLGESDQFLSGSDQSDASPNRANRDREQGFALGLEYDRSDHFGQNGPNYVENELSTGVFGSDQLSAPIGLNRNTVHWT